MNIAQNNILIFFLLLMMMIMKHEHEHHKIFVDHILFFIVNIINIKIYKLEFSFVWQWNNASI